jgi:type II secretion system protein C
MNANKITERVEGRIVELSLEHPNYAARHLVPLLKQEGITVTTSGVYEILKRNDLHTRSKRLRKLEDQRSDKTHPEPDSTTPPPGEQQDHLSAYTADKTPQPCVPRAIEVVKRIKARRPWYLTIPSLFLLAIAVYLWVSAATNYLQVRHEPTLTSESSPSAVELRKQIPARPLEEYNIIAERDLFGGSKEKASVSQEEVVIGDIPNSEKSISLKLVGTVAGDESTKRFAIIYDQNTRRQGLYREGDKVGEVLIRRILYNNVIVDTGSGEETLAVEIEESEEKVEFSSPPERAEKKVTSSARHRNLRLDRKEVEASLSDIDGLLQQVRITPYTIGSQPKGFRISDIPPGSVLTKMGLPSGSVIRAINDVPITGPEQAAAFLEKIREGGDIEIRFTKRRRTMRISLKIE